MEPVAGRNALERGLHVLERLNDPELVEAYRAFMEHLEVLVGPDNLDTYVQIYQRGRREVSHQAAGTPLSLEEQAVSDKVAADPTIHALYDRYIALAKAHGIVEPDIDQA